MKYRNLLIGEICSSNFAETIKVSFLSDESLLDYDVLFCDLNGLTWFFPEEDESYNASEFRNFFHFLKKGKVKLKIS